MLMQMQVQVRVLVMPKEIQLLAMQCKLYAKTAKQDLIELEAIAVSHILEKGNALNTQNKQTVKPKKGVR